MASKSAPGVRVHSQRRGAPHRQATTAPAAPVRIPDNFPGYHFFYIQTLRAMSSRKGADQEHDQMDEAASEAASPTTFRASTPSSFSLRSVSTVASTVSLGAEFENFIWDNDNFAWANEAPNDPQIAENPGNDWNPPTLETSYRLVIEGPLSITYKIIALCHMIFLSCQDIFNPRFLPEWNPVAAFLFTHFNATGFVGTLLTVAFLRISQTPLGNKRAWEAAHIMSWLHFILAGFSVVPFLTGLLPFIGGPRVVNWMMTPFFFILFLMHFCISCFYRNFGKGVENMRWHEKVMLLFFLILDVEGAATSPLFLTIRPGLQRHVAIYLERVLTVCNLVQIILLWGATHSAVELDSGYVRHFWFIFVLSSLYSATLLIDRIWVVFSGLGNDVDALYHALLIASHAYLAVRGPTQPCFAAFTDSAHCWVTSQVDYAGFIWYSVAFMLNVVCIDAHLARYLQHRKLVMKPSAAVWKKLQPSFEAIHAAATWIFAVPQSVLTRRKKLLYFSLPPIAVALAAVCGYHLFATKEYLDHKRPGSVPLRINQPFINICGTLENARGPHEQDGQMPLVHAKKHLCLNLDRYLRDLPVGAHDFAEAVCKESSPALHLVRHSHKSALRRRRLISPIRDETPMILTLCQSPLDQTLCDCPQGPFPPSNGFQSHHQGNLPLVQAYLDHSRGWNGHFRQQDTYDVNRVHPQAPAVMNWALDLLEYVAMTDHPTQPLQKLRRLRLSQSSDTEAVWEMVDRALQIIQESRSATYDTAIDLLVSLAQLEALRCSLRSLIPLHPSGRNEPIRHRTFTRPGDLNQGLGETAFWEPQECPGLEYALAPLEASVQDLRDRGLRATPVSYFVFASLTLQDARSRYKLYVDLPTLTAKHFRLPGPTVRETLSPAQRALRWVFWAPRLMVRWAAELGVWAGEGLSKAERWQKLEIQDLGFQQSLLSEAVRKIGNAYSK